MKNIITGLKSKAWIGKIFSGFILSALLSNALFAADIRASLDRNQVQAGETVVLSINMSGTSKASPDLAPLQKDFDILGTGTSSQTTIINGKRTDSRKLNITLMPRSEGVLTIPAIKVGGDETPPIKLTVSAVPVVSNPGNTGTPGAKATAKKALAGNPVWLEIETPLKNHKVVVQQEIPLTVRLYSAIPLQNLSISTPTPEHAVIEKLGEDKQYQKEYQGQRYQVVEQHYAVFPEQSGELKIPSVVLRATTPDPNRQQQGFGRGSLFNDPFFKDAFSGNSALQRMFNDPFFGGGGKPVTLRSNAVTFNVDPIPAEALGKTWLPAHQVTLSSSWQQQMPKLASGEPVSMSVTVTANGLTGSQIPAISMESVPGQLRVYNESTKTENFLNGNQLIGTSTQTFTLIPEKSGKLNIPAVKVDWWNIDTQSLETAQLPAQIVNVAQGTGKANISPSLPVANPMNAAANQPLNQVNGGVGDRSLASTKDISKTWLWIAFVAALLGALFLLWRNGLMRKQKDSNAISTDTNSEPRPVEKKQDKIASNQLKQECLKACEANDAQKTANALVRWARHEWHDDIPISLLDIASQVEQGSDAIEELYRYLYQPEVDGFNSSWSGKALASALQQGLKHKPQRKRSKEEKSLPPLYPA